MQRADVRRRPAVFQFRCLCGKVLANCDSPFNVCLGEKDLVSINSDPEPGQQPPRDTEGPAQASPLPESRPAETTLTESRLSETTLPELLHVMPAQPELHAKMAAATPEPSSLAKMAAATPEPSSPAKMAAATPEHSSPGKLAAARALNQDGRRHVRAYSSPKTCS